jgi:hypothetical protein
MEGSDPVAIGSHVYLAYATGPELVFLASNDGGFSFIEQRLDDGNGTAVNHPRIAAYRSRVYVTWNQDEGGTSHLVFRQSTNYGAGFNPPITLGNTVRNDSTQIAADGLGLTLAFINADDETVLTSSADGGETWPFSRTVGTAGAKQEREETVGRLGQQIVASWSMLTDTGDNYAYVASSADGGASYHVTKLTPVSNGAKERAVAVSPTTGLWFIYAIDRSQSRGHIGGRAVLFTSANGGSTWTKQRLSSNTMPGSILVSGQTIYLTWLEHFPDGVHVKLGFSPDSGGTWRPPSDLSGSIGVSLRLLGNAHQPWISIWEKIISVVYMTNEGVITRSTDDITKYLSLPIMVGSGTNGMISGGNVLWLGPNIGQNQPVFYARCQ